MVENKEVECNGSNDGGTTSGKVISRNDPVRTILSLHGGIGEATSLAAHFQRLVSNSRSLHGCPLPGYRAKSIEASQDGLESASTTRTPKGVLILEKGRSHTCTALSDDFVSIGPPNLLVTLLENVRGYIEICQAKV